MASSFDKMEKKLGFGCMRLPKQDETVDHAAFCQMVDAFLEAGFNYFDTAHGYLSGQSETALRACLTSRHPRESYVLTNKLTENYFSSQEDIRPMFQSQLDACGVEYFDFYLMHSQNKRNFAKYKACQAYETAMELKAEGKIRHLGISFHDNAEVLEQILTEYPQIEVVQIQFNYIDYEDPAIQSRKCYEVCRKFGKPIIVMEPVKGGGLVNLTPDAQAILDALQSGSNASYAIRFAAGFEGVIMVLSGMGSLEMVKDNCGYMKDFQPLNEAEHAAITKVAEIIRAQKLIPCTGCRYCTEVCRQGIAIPELFACLNAKKQFNAWTVGYYNNIIHAQIGSKPSDCMQCGCCERVCPQHLQIRDLLLEVRKEYEK